MLVDDLKGLILLKQEEIPTGDKPRDIVLPVDSGKIVTTVGVRRCGKSTLMNIAINILLEKGVQKEARRPTRCPSSIA